MANYYYASAATTSSATISQLYPTSAVASQVQVGSIRILNASTTTATTLDLYYHNTTASTNTRWYTSAIASSFAGELLSKTLVINPNDYISYSSSPTSNISLVISGLFVDRT